MEGLKNRRIEYIDLAKGICIILVVMMHIFPEVGEGSSLLVNLRMPLYYCLSGMFFKTYGNFKSFLIKKTDKLLLPFIAWYLISYAVYYIRVLAIGHPEHVFHILDLFYAPDFYNGSLWFLLSLFWCNLLFFLVHSLTNKEWIRLLIVGSLAVGGCILSHFEIRNFLYLGTSLTCLPFFYFGKMILDKKIFSHEKSTKKDILLAVSSLSLIVLFIYILSMPPQLIFYYNILIDGSYLIFFLVAASLIILALVICKYINKLPYVSFLGRYSIIVLVTHRLMANVIGRFVEHVSGIDMDTPFSHGLMFFVIIALMAVVIPLCRKFLPYICSQKSWLEGKIEKYDYRFYRSA